MRSAAATCSAATTAKHNGTQWTPPGVGNAMKGDDKAVKSWLTGRALTGTEQTSEKGTREPEQNHTEPATDANSDTHQPCPLGSAKLARPPGSESRTSQRGLPMQQAQFVRSTSDLVSQRRTRLSNSGAIGRRHPNQTRNTQLDGARAHTFLRSERKRRGSILPRSRRNQRNGCHIRRGNAERRTLDSMSRVCRAAFASPAAI